MRPVAPQPKADPKPKTQRGLKRLLQKSMLMPCLAPSRWPRKEVTRNFCRYLKLILRQRNDCRRGGKLFGSRMALLAHTSKGTGTWEVSSSPQTLNSRGCLDLSASETENGTFFDVYGTDLERQYVQMGLDL